MWTPGAEAVQSNDLSVDLGDLDDLLQLGGRFVVLRARNDNTTSGE